MTINSINIPKCSKAGCLRPPLKVPVLCVPRKGIPITHQNPIKAIIDMPLCNYHIGEPTVRELLTEAMQHLFVVQCRITKSTPPDFDHAFVGWCRMDDKRYLSVLAQKRRLGRL